MTRTKILTIIWIFVIFLGCGSSNNPKVSNHIAASKINIDTSVISILAFDTTYLRFYKECKPAELTSMDIQRIETILIKCILDYNPLQERKFLEINRNHPEYKLDIRYYIIDLKRYKRQYIAVINKKGEKEVFINCFCGNWDKGSRTGLVIVLDGGNCFFNVKVNLKTNTYYDFMVNGEA